MKKLATLLILAAVMVLFSSCSQQTAPATSQSPAKAPATSSASPATSKAPAAAPAKTYSWRLVNHFKEGDIRLEHQKQWVDAVSKATNGAVKITIYPAESLVKIADEPEAISKGLVELAGPFTLAMYPGIVPLANMWEPFSPTNYAKYVEDPEILKILNKEAAQKVNAYYIFPLSMGNSAWFLNKPFTSPEDMKGKLIRSTGGKVRDAYITAFGGKTVSMTTGEVYTAGQRGVIDGTNITISSYNSMKLYEVFPYVLDAKVCNGSVIPNVMNLDLWKSLSPELQKILTDTGYEITRRAYSEVIAQDAKVFETLSGKGLIKISPIDQTIRAEWIKRGSASFETAFQGTGAVGDELLQYLKKNYWN